MFLCLACPACGIVRLAEPIRRSGARRTEQIRESTAEHSDTSCDHRKKQGREVFLYQQEAFILTNIAVDWFCERLHAHEWRPRQKEWDCRTEDGEGGRSCSWSSLWTWYQRMDWEWGNPDALLGAPAPKITLCVRMLDLCLTLSPLMSFHCKFPAAWKNELLFDDAPRFF